MTFELLDELQVESTISIKMELPVTPAIFYLLSLEDP